MTIDEARDLFAYGSWANGHMFTAAEALAPSELETPAPSSFPSVRETLGHIVAAEWVWLRRWRGESPGAPPPWGSESTLPDLRGELNKVQSERSEYLETLNDSDLVGVVEYRRLSGEKQADPLGSLMRHVVNHSTYHRGQLATQLRQLGKVPPNTDLVTYLRR